MKTDIYFNFTNITIEDPEQRADFCRCPFLVADEDDNFSNATSEISEDVEQITSASELTTTTENSDISLI